jgi:hypothetical protein
MTKSQTSLRNKYDSILDVLLRFIAIYLLYLPMVSAKDDLIAKAGLIDEADAIQRRLLKSFRIDKRNKKKKQGVLAKALARKNQRICG